MSVVFHTSRRQHIEELRAELRNAVDAAERQELRTELERAQAELTALMAQVFCDGAPPF